MYVDLHCHSNNSDGLKTIPELINIAKNNNVNFLSITDHDSLESIKLIKSDKEIQMVNGIELSTIYNYNGNDKYIHLLGYDFDSNSKDMIEELKRMRQLLTYENIKFLNNVIENKIYIPVEVILDIDLSNYKWIHKQIENSLIKNGYDKSYIYDIMEKINKIVPEYEGYEVSTDKAIKLINDSGGISVLAHPSKIKLDDSEKYNLIKNLKNIGLMGIESSYSYYSQEDFIRYSEIAKKLNLLESVGSDYHYDTENNCIVIGHGINNNLLKEDCSVKRFILERKNNHG